MSQNEQKKQFSSEFDNSQRIIKQVWNVVNNEHNRKHEHIGSNLYQTGPVKILKDQLLKIISSANKMIVMSSFLFADEEIKQALIHAAAKNVDIYLLIAAKSRLEKEPDGDSEFEKRVYEDHIRMLNELTPYVYLRSADHFHAKVVLADPFSERPSGMLLTANVTTDALERNEELGVYLDPLQIQEIISILRLVFWEEAEHHAIDDRLATISPLHRLVPLVDQTVVYYNCKSSNTLKDRVRNLIQQAQKEIIFSTFGIDPKHEMFSLLKEKLSQGIKVKLFARSRRGKMNQVFSELEELGAEIYGFDWLHAKAFLIDGQVGFLMTANLEPHGMDSGFELGLDLSHEDTKALAKLFWEWEIQHQYRYHASQILGNLSLRFFQFESGNGQYSLKEFKESLVLPKVQRQVYRAEDLEYKEEDFAEFQEKAQSTKARKVTLILEKAFSQANKKS